MQSVLVRTVSFGNDFCSRESERNEDRQRANWRSTGLKERESAVAERERRKKENKMFRDRGWVAAI
eukprot:1251771-Pleurochrysis_carterae.AAC.1